MINMNEIMILVDGWLRKNKLKFNGDKTEFMVTGREAQVKKVTVPDLVVGGHTVQPTSSIRNLGAYQDERLNMKVHVTNTTKSANFHLHNLCRIKRYLDMDTMKIVVHASITSRLDYANSLLCNVPYSTIKPLQQIQNSAARLITSTRRYDHITPVLKSLHWLPVDCRIVFKVLLFTYKSLNGLAPQYLVDLLQLHKPSRTLRSSTSEPLRLVQPLTKLVSAGDRAFAAAAPRLWNQLPVDIRTATTVNIFKKKLKTHLFKKAFN